ncbi:unnamed protein product [Closterium sp. NIES-54]
MGQKLADSESYFPVVCEFDVVPRLKFSMFSLLADLKAKVESFWEFVRQMQVLNSYPTNLIVNANQTPLFLEMPQERTLEMKGACTVHVRAAGYEKECLTVMLAVTASGLKLPLYVVFKRKTIPKVKVPRGNLKKPPAELVLKWIDEAWADAPEEMVRKAFLTCGISNAEDGSQDNLILAHMRDSGEVEVLEDVMEEEQDELVPNPFYPAPVVTPPDVTVEMEEEAVLAAEAEEADEEAVPAKSDSSESDDGNANEADEWSDEGDEWWAPGRYEGAEVDEWVAGDEDE